MKKIGKLLIVLSLVLVMFTGCSRKPEVEFSTFVDNLAKEAFEEDDYALNMFFNDPKTIGITPKPYKLKYTSKEDYEEGILEDQQTLDELKKYKYKDLSEQEQYDYDVIHFALTTALENTDSYYISHDYLGPFGVVPGFAMNLQMYSFNNEFDIDAYFNLIESMPEVYAQYVEHEKDRLDHNSGINTAEKKKLLDLCDQVINDKNHFLLNDFETKVQAADFLSTQQKVDYVVKNKEVMEDSFKEAHRIIKDGIEPLDVKKMDSLTLADVEGGQAYYENKIKRRLGKDISVKNIEKIMLDELATGITEVQSLSLSVDGKQLDQLDEEISVKQLSETLEMLFEEMQSDFPKINHPDVKTLVVDKSMEDTFAPAAYKIPKYDVKEEPETIIVNPKHNFDMATLVHEGYPGHLLQNVYSRQNNVPMIRSLLDTHGYVEGWAKYVEDYTPKLLGLDENVQKMTIAYNRFSNAFGTLVDIDVNYNGISLDEFSDKYGEMLNPEVPIDEIYYQVQEDPGNAIPYYMGAYLFRSLKAQAHISLGEQYSDQLFHEIMLEDGPLPFASLETKLSSYKAK